MSTATHQQTGARHVTTGNRHYRRVCRDGRDSVFRLPGESWPECFQRLRELAATECRYRRTPFFDPIPYHPGKLLTIRKMPRRLQMPAVAQWNADGKLTPEQANRAVERAWFGGSQSVIPRRMMQNLMRKAGFVTNVPNFTFDDLPPRLALYRGGMARCTPDGWSWTPQIETATYYARSGVQGEGRGGNDWDDDGWPKSVYRVVAPREAIAGLFVPLRSGDQVEVLLDWDRLPPEDQAGYREFNALGSAAATQLSLLRFVGAYREHYNGDLAQLRILMEQRGLPQWLFSEMDKNPDRWPYRPRKVEEWFSEDQSWGFPPLPWDSPLTNPGTVGLITDGGDDV